MYEKTEKKEYKLAPAGTHTFIIDDVREKESAKGGVFLSIRFKICCGDHEGISVFESVFKSFPSNPAVVDYSIERENKIKEALGSSGLGVENFVGHKINGYVVIEKGRDGIVRNKIKYYSPYVEDEFSQEFNLDNEDIPF